VAEARDEVKLPEHVQQYILQAAIASLPREVLETLASMTPDELSALERLGKTLKGAEPHHSCNYAFAVH
jgi:hypothetical protein